MIQCLSLLAATYIITHASNIEKDITLALYHNLWTEDLVSLNLSLMTAVSPAVKFIWVIV